jgi:hypothetical protein
LWLDSIKEVLKIMGFRNLETTVAGMGSMESYIRRGQFSWWAVAQVEKKNKLTRV